MTFKEKLVILRKTKHLTQDEFASAVGVSRQAVYKWESGQSYPEVPKLLEMKLLFGITIDELLDDNYDIPLPEKKKRKRMSKEAKLEIEKSVSDSVAKAPAATAPKAAPAAPKAAPAAPKAAPAAPKAAPAAPKAAPAAPKAAPAVETPVFTPAPKEAPVFTPVNSAPVEPVFTPVESITDAPTYKTVSGAEDDGIGEKKSGFFGRLFGRR